MAENPISGGSSTGLPSGPTETPPSLALILILDLVGTVLLAIGVLTLAMPDQQWIPASWGLGDNAVGLVVFGMALVGIAAFLLIKRVRMTGAVVDDLSDTET